MIILVTTQSNSPIPEISILLSTLYIIIDYHSLNSPLLDRLYRDINSLLTARIVLDIKAAVLRVQSDDLSPPARNHRMEVLDSSSGQGDLGLSS
jgi:hypothetical protein